MRLHLSESRLARPSHRGTNTRRSVSLGIDMEVEFWMPVVGWEGLYEVSEYGVAKETVKSVLLRKTWSHIS